MFCSPKKIAENQSNQSPIYQSRLHLDCTNGGNPRAIEWNATELHQLWEQCNLGSIWPIDGQSIQNWGFQLWFAINPNLTADRHVWALTRGQVQTDAWGPLQSSRGPTIQNTRSPGLSQSWCNRWSRLLQSTRLHRNSGYLQSCYNSDRLPFDWTLIRKWAQGFRLRRLLRIRERTIAMLIQSSTITRIDEGLCSSKESLDNPPILAQSIQFWKFDQQSGNPRAIAQNLAILGHFQNCMIAIPQIADGLHHAWSDSNSIQKILWSFCNPSTISKSCCNSMEPHNFHTIGDCPPIANYGPVSAVLSWLTGIAKESQIYNTLQFDWTVVHQFPICCNLDTMQTDCEAILKSTAIHNRINCSGPLQQRCNLPSAAILRIAEGLRDARAFPRTLWQSSNLCAIHSI